MTVYNFETQLAKGEQAEAVLDAFFSGKFIVEKATPDQQRREIDRVLIDRYSKRRIAVEYKTDWTASRSGNAFVETVSVDTRNVRGWAYTSQADYLAYYVPGDKLIYIMRFSTLREQLPGWKYKYQRRAIPNAGYKTIGLLVPLHEFERHSLEVVSL